MISKRTVFVLGAGASIPYGLPSGARLRELLCYPAQHGYSNGTDWMGALTKLGIYEKESRGFSEAFLKSGVASIDSFLSRRLNDYGHIGKAAIATILCSLEQPSSLHRTENQDDWYTHLWNSLVSGIHKCDDLSNNQVKFVTFNYDRSLEYFFHQSCKETFGVSDAEALRTLESIKITHVYGLLGKYDLERYSGTRPYESSIDPYDITVASQGIKIIPESRDDAPEFAEAREMFRWAEQACFLGFGFDPLNVSRLNLDAALSGRRVNGFSLRIVASTFGKTNAENAAIERSIPTSAGWWERHEKTNLMTIRESGVLL